MKSSLYVSRRSYDLIMPRVRRERRRASGCHTPTRPRRSGPCHEPHFTVMNGTTCPRSSDSGRGITSEADAAVAALLTCQLHPRKGPTDPGAVIVHVPLPRVRRATIDERGMKTRRRRVVEDERNRVARHASSARADRIEG